MSQRLIENIEKTIGKSLSQEESAFISKLLRPTLFQKKQMLCREGGTCDRIFFIEEGSCYSFITDEKGEAHVLQFALEGYWISDLYSFFSGGESIYSIETIETTKALELSRDDFNKACDAYPVFDRFFRVLIQNAYVALQFRLAKTTSEEALRRYETFEKLHPDFLQRMPQYLIASYLGIQPQSLSRLRKKRLQR